MYENNMAKFAIMEKLEQNKLSSYEELVKNGQNIFYIFPFINHIRTRLFKILETVNSDKKTPFIPKLLKRRFQSHCNTINNF